MTDLTKITTPFGLLDEDTQNALQRAQSEGKIIEWYAGSDWDHSRLPLWSGNITFRVKPDPLKPITLNWSYLRPDVKYIARDKGGKVFGYTGQPRVGESEWLPVYGSGDNAFYLGIVADTGPGTVDWRAARDTTIERLLAERDAAYAAGQRDMRVRAIQIAQEKHDLAVKWASHHLKEFSGETDSLLIVEQIHALPIKETEDD